MGNIPSKRHSHLSSSSKNGTHSGLPRPTSLGGSTALSLSRFPSLGGAQPSSIPEDVVIANNPDRKASEPILIRPRIPPALTEGVGSSSALSSITGTASIPNGHAVVTKQPPAVVIDEATSTSLNHSSSVSSCLGNVNVNEVLTKLLEVGYSGRVNKHFCLKNSEITAICSAAREIFLSQPTLLELSPPVKIVGDIHGQYHDLLRLFEMCSYPPATNYLFLGDYVDRGKQSLETIMLLLCYKIKFPENFFLLRGNHECANVTRVYGFYDECKRRMTVKTWKTFITTFNTMPIAALVANKIFCVHGGLSPSLTSMDDVRRITRPTEIPDYGLLNDLLWSDPSDAALEWDDNERGVSYCFGRKVVGDFLARHDLDLVCRAHMVVEDGYEFFADRKLVTLFSAPNYCGEFDNYGAVMGVGEELMCSFELLKPPEGNFGALNSNRRLSGFAAVAATPSEAASDTNEELPPVSPPG